MGKQITQAQRQVLKTLGYSGKKFIGNTQPFSTGSGHSLEITAYDTFKQGMILLEDSAVCNRYSLEDSFYLPEGPENFPLHGECRGSTVTKLGQTVIYATLLGIIKDNTVTDPVKKIRLLYATEAEPANAVDSLDTLSTTKVRTVSIDDVICFRELVQKQ